MTDATAFAALSQELLAAHEEGTTAELICLRAVDLLAPVTWASMTVRRRRARLETLASTDRVAARADELQHELGQGPCLDSAIDDEPFLIRQVTTDERWPEWGRRTAALGIRSVVSVQLPATALDPQRAPLGALNLYADADDAFDDAILDRVLVLTVHAANALGVAKLVTGLQEAVSARHHVGIAQGVLAQCRGIAPEVAFEHMREVASRDNRKLRDVATEVIEQGGLGAEVIEESDLADR